MAFLAKIGVTISLFFTLIFAGIFGLPNTSPPPAAPTEQTSAATASITESEALTSVQRLSEVEKWLTIFNNPNGSSVAGGKPSFVVSSTTNSYVVHVFEYLPDHVATFNWYYVDKTSGKISSQF